MPDFHIYDILEQSSCVHIVDVGAAPVENSPEIYQFLVRQGDAQVVGFEPDEKACAELNAQFQGTANRCLPFFIGDGSDGIFHTMSSPLCSSLLPPNHAVIEMFTGLKGLFNVVGREEVTTTRLDEVPDLGDVDFLKIDVQGAELDVLKGASDVLKETMFIFSEVEFVELYENQPLFGEIATYLREKGFMFHMFAGAASRALKPMIVQNDLNKGLKQMIWGDAIFIPDPRSFKDYSTEKLSKLAMIMHEMVESYDVTLAILNVIDDREGSALSSEYLSRF